MPFVVAPEFVGMTSATEKATLIKNSKGKSRIAALTAYDYPMARMLDQAGLDLILVGDSLGMVVLGYKDTTHVTMEDMIHHVRAVARAGTRAMVVADLPIGSYANPAKAVENARRLVEAGAEGVKAEGGVEIFSQVEAIVKAEIPFMGHIGMLPQKVVIEGGYKIKGRQQEERASLLSDAQALERAGAFAFVMELITAEVACEISHSTRLPTIGIGSGEKCDGQILVTHDLIGLFPWFKPGFVKQQADAASMIHGAVQNWLATFRPEVNEYAK